MRRGRTTLAAIAVAAMVVFAAPTAGAAPKQVAFSQDSGSLPWAYASASTERPVRLTYRVTATPPAPIELEWDVTCTRGGSTVGREFEAVSTPPLSGQVPLTIRRADNCYWSVDAEYPDYEQDGTISVWLYAEKRPYWMVCRRPAWAKRGLLKVSHEASCSVGRRVTRKVRNKPASEGTFLTLGKWTCDRWRRGIRCLGGTPDEIIRFRGPVRWPGQGR